MSTSYVTDRQMLGIGLLVARLVLGLLMAAHGAQKLFGWFGGYGLNATGEFMVQLGFPSGRSPRPHRWVRSRADCSSHSDCSGRSGRRS